MNLVKIDNQRLKALNTKLSTVSKAIGLENPELARAVDQLRVELFEINERDRLAGVDWRGNRLPPVTYRPVKGGKKLGRGYLRSRPRTSSRGNLTSAQYRTLAGPPLAPRGRASRVITNYVTSAAIRDGVVRISAGWRDILDRRGRPFLQYHIQGAGRLPKRDIAGLSLAARALLGDRIMDTISKVFKDA